jgi:hypothetical protein
LLGLAVLFGRLVTAFLIAVDSGCEKTGRDGAGVYCGGA